jgi:hypothetical protein
MLHLEDVLLRLWRAGINCGVGTAPPAGVQAWLQVHGDETETADFNSQGRQDEISRWLDTTARRFYPDALGPRGRQPEGSGQ